jgi:hypothetical protein
LGVLQIKQPKHCLGGEGADHNRRVEVRQTNGIRLHNLPALSVVGSDPTKAVHREDHETAEKFSVVYVVTRHAQHPETFGLAGLVRDYVLLAESALWVRADFPQPPLRRDRTIFTPSIESMLTAKASSPPGSLRRPRQSGPDD